MNAVSELVVTMPNVVPFCAGMQSTLQIDRKVSRWLRGFLTSAVVRRGPGVPGGTAHIPRQHRDRRSHRPDRQTGENFDEGVHLALGERGSLERDWRPEADGGFSALRRLI